LNSDDELVEGVMVPITQKGVYEVRDFMNRGTTHTREVEDGKDMAPGQAQNKYAILRAAHTEVRAKENALTTAEMLAIVAKH
jgi:hypothetical protein